MNEIEAYYYGLLEKTGHIYTVLLLVPVVTALVYWKQLNKPLKVFFWYLVARVAIVITSEALYWAFVKYNAFWSPFLKAAGISNMHFMNIFVSMAQVMGMGYFYILISRSPAFNRVVRYVAGGLLLLILLDYFFFEGYKQFGRWTWVEGIYILVLPGVFLWRIIKKDTDVVPLKNAYFLVSLGLFIPHLIALIYSFLGNSLYETHLVLFVKLQLARNGINVFGQLLFFLAFRRAYLMRFWDRISWQRRFVR